jgi:hypothetical protein
MRTLLSTLAPTMQNDPDTISVDGDSASNPSVDRDPILKFNIHRTSAWFLGDNVRIADDVESETPSLLFITGQKDSGNGKQPEIRGQDAKEATEISLEFYEELQNMVTSTWIRHTQGKLSTTITSILLSSSVKNSRNILDEIVHRLAKDLGADLISLDTDDIEQLACDFARDEQPYISEETDFRTRYFAVRCQKHSGEDIWNRNKASFGAVLGAADIKALRGRGHDKDEHECDRYCIWVMLDKPAMSKNSPLLIHYKDAKIMWGQDKGPKFFARMHDHVKQRRALGAAVTVIATLSPGGVSDKGHWTEEPKLRRKIGVPKYGTVALKPSHIFNRASSLDEPCRGATPSNIRRLRCGLHLRVSRLFPPGLLESDAEWAHALGGTKTLKSLHWSNDKLNKVILRVAGRA